MTNFKNQAFYIIDHLGNIISWTNSAAEMYGYSAADIIGKHISFFYTEEDTQKNELQNLLDKARKSHGYITRGWRHMKGGGLLNAEETFTSLYAGEM